jgi:hypothetical protein
MQIGKSSKQHAAESLEAARKDLGVLKDFTLIGTITHVYQMACDRELPWATHEVEETAINAMDRAVLEWRTASTFRRIRKKRSS